MAEEQRCQEGHRLCANNCGFFGSPATLDLCSKCYRDLRLKEDRASSAKIAVEKSLSPSSSSASASASPSTSSAVGPLPAAALPESSERVVDQAPPPPPTIALPPAGPSRCTACRKRVGLTGFKCRCGATYCGTHRYPEQHGCSFDFKAAGREAIARANPVVKGDKLVHKI